MNAGQGTDAGDPPGAEAAGQIGGQHIRLSIGERPGAHSQQVVIGMLALQSVQLAPRRSACP